MRYNLHIDKLDLGHGYIIENDELKSLMNEDNNNDTLNIEDSATELIDMARKLDSYYSQHGF